MAGTKLEGWLKGRGFTLERAVVPDRRERVLGEIATSIAGSAMAQELVRDAASTMKTKPDGPNVSIGVRPEYSTSDVSAASRLAERLDGLGYLRIVQIAERSVDFMTYRKKDALRGEIISFFDGGWLEQFALAGLARAADEVLLNVHIAGQHGARAELDVIGWAAGGPVWIECKCGRYQDHLGRYRALRDRLQLRPERAILLVRGIDEDRAEDVSAVHRLTVVSERHLADRLEHVSCIAQESGDRLPAAQMVPSRCASVSDRAARPPGDASAASPAPENTEFDAQALSALKTAGLRPRSECRASILRATADVVEHAHRPLTHRELRDAAATRAGVTTSAVTDVLRALIRGDALSLASAESGHFGDQIVVVKVSSVAELEAACRAAYLEALEHSVHPPVGPATDAA